MALADIKQKILSEAKAKAAEITAATEKLVAEHMTAAQKQGKAERQKVEAVLAKEIGQAVQRRRQILILAGEHKILALKREYLQQILDGAVEQIKQKKLPEFYAKILKGSDFNNAQIFVGADTAPVKAACQKLGVEPKIVLKKDWPAGRLEIDYGRSRVDCSLSLYAQELARTLEAELAEKLWP